MRCSWVGWSWLALACGPAVVVAEAEDGGGSETTGGQPQTESSEASSGSPSTTDDAETTSETGSDETGDVPAGLCGRAGDELLAVLTTDENTSLLRGDGTRIALDLDAPAPPAGASTRHDGALADAGAVAIETWSLVDRGTQHGSFVGMFDADGTRSWTHAFDGATVSGPLIGSDGSVLVSLYTDAGESSAALIEGAGAPRSLPAFHPRAPRRSDGLVPGQRAEAGGNPAGWLDPDDLSFQPVTLAAEQAWVTFRDEDIVYVAGDAVVVETPTTMTTVPLPAVEELSVMSAALPWLLLGTPERDVWARVSLDGVSEALEPAAPRGSDLFTCYFLEAAIDRHGDILLPTRNGASATIHRLDPGAAAWAPVGEPVTLVDKIDARAVGDTYIVLAHGQNETFCPPQAWGRPAPELSGTSAQIVRPIDDVARVLPAEATYAMTLDAEGLCIAYTDAERGTLLLDATTGDEVALGFEAGVAF